MNGCDKISVEDIKRFIQNLNLTKSSIVAIVGAGASVASGLRTFRGEDGYYQGKFPQELASRRGFAENPTLVWEWYKMRMETTFNAKPNEIHHSLVKLEHLELLDLVITQNVDGLHKRAGQKNIVEVHGTISETHCLENCGIKIKLEEPPTTIPVKCECGSYQRPSVIWFGEQLDHTQLDRAQESLLNAKLVLIIGTSGYVYPVASFPVIAKKYAGAKLVEFNPNSTPFEQIDDLFIQGPAEVNLPRFVELLEEKYLT